MPQVNDQTETRSNERAGEGSVNGDVIDACAFPAWPGTAVLVEYMGEPWGELLLRPGDRSGPASVLSPRLYVDPKRPQMQAEFEWLKQELVEGGVRERVVLGWDDGLFSTVYPHQYIARMVIHAANDWLVDQWLSRDEAFYGMMLISSAMPEVAAAEIRRVGANERIVAVALGCNGLGRPFGDNIYLPIFEAAAEMRLPVVLQLGSDASTDQVTPPVAGGLPATFAEYRALGVHSHMSHLASMMVEGLFERLPSLQLLLVGGGFAWVPSWLWRLNSWLKQYRRTQAPWLNRLPSDYFLDHVRITTDSFESPRDASQLERVLNAIPNLERTVMYASCCPSIDFEGPAEIAARLPASWRTPVLRDNALSFFRWPAISQDSSREPPVLTTSTQGR
jgi:predicted TIM-barrel fold metal-dependent hydrolase